MTVGAMLCPSYIRICVISKGSITGEHCIHNSSSMLFNLTHNYVAKYKSRVCVNMNTLCFWQFIDACWNISVVLYQSGIGMFDTKISGNQTTSSIR